MRWSLSGLLFLSGTSSGTMACWDMRFQLPISSHFHPSRARIRRLSMHPLYQSWVIAGKREGWFSVLRGFLRKCRRPSCPGSYS